MDAGREIGASWAAAGGALADGTGDGVADGGVGGWVAGGGAIRPAVVGIAVSGAGRRGSWTVRPTENPNPAPKPMAPAIASAVQAARHLIDGAAGVLRTNADGGRLFIINPRDNEPKPTDDHDELIVLDYPHRQRVNPRQSFLW